MISYPAILETQLKGKHLKNQPFYNYITKWLIFTLPSEYIIIPLHHQNLLLWCIIVFWQN